MSLDRPTAPNPYDLLPQVPSLTVTSTSCEDGADLSDAQVFDGWGFTGGNRSPHLTWSGAPEGTASYAVTCFDADAPTPSGFWHWTVVGIPADVTELAEDAGSEGGAALPEGAFHVVNDFGTKAFGGAAPPQGDRPHRYLFAVHALDTDDLGIDDSVSAAVASFNIGFHTLARGVLTGRYENA
jgi:Raf kinase inhibitor-like YbhB/YbcL family protein